MLNIIVITEAGSYHILVLSLSHIRRFPFKRLVIIDKAIAELKKAIPDVRDELSNIICEEFQLNALK